MFPSLLFKLSRNRVGQGGGQGPWDSVALKGRLLSLQEMASDELRELRNAMTQEAIREHQMAKTGGTTTDLFQCSKCKKKNCTYNQVWDGGCGSAEVEKQLLEEWGEKGLKLRAAETRPSLAVPVASRKCSPACRITQTGVYEAWLASSGPP